METLFFSIDSLVYTRCAEIPLISLLATEPATALYHVSSSKPLNFCILLHPYLDVGKGSALEVFPTQRVCMRPLQRRLRR